MSANLFLLLDSLKATRGEAVLRADAARLLARAETEKIRMARTLHDDLGQRLTALNLALSVWKSELDSGQGVSLKTIRSKLANLTDLTSAMIGITRQVTGTLRPRVLEEFGLAAAFKWHLKKVQKQTGVMCRFHSGRGRIKLPDLVAAQLFRIGTEMIAGRIKAGVQDLRVRLIIREDTVALVFEGSGKEHRISSEVRSRVRLLGGVIEVNHERQSLMMPLPNRT